jgi:hypothetical protein
MKLKINLFIFSFVLAFISCEPDFGSLTGNAFWKYNNYVGNKPDAGSTAYLFSQDTSKAALETTCDVQGNFKFDKVPTGDYMLVIKSKNTTTNAPDQLEEMFIIETNKYFGFSLKQIDSSLFNQAIASYFESQKKYASAPPSYTYKQILAYDDSARYFRKQANKLADSLFDKIPKDNRLMREIFLLGTMSKKVKFKKVKIKKNETANEVFDFGITFY